MKRRIRSLSERLYARTERRGECLLWTGCVEKSGHGRINRGDKTLILTHVAAWELVFGPVPPGKELHHTCFTPACINTDHLKALTPAEHRALHAATKTTCNYGHPLDGRYAHGRRQRYCKVCKRRWNREYKQRRKAAA